MFLTVIEYVIQFIWSFSFLRGFLINNNILPKSFEKIKKKIT